MLELLFLALFGAATGALVDHVSKDDEDPAVPTDEVPEDDIDPDAPDLIDEPETNDEAEGPPAAVEPDTPFPEGDEETDPPVEPVPVDPTPVEPVPLEPVTVDPTPVDPAPVEPVPVIPVVSAFGPHEAEPVDPTIDPAQVPVPGRDADGNMILRDGAEVRGNALDNIFTVQA